MAYHQLNMKVAQMETRLQKVESTVTTLEQTNTATVNRVDRMESDITQVKKDVKESSTKTVEEATWAISMEMREREARKNNLILYGIPEMEGATSGEARKSHDNKKVNGLLTTIGLNINISEEAKFAVRIGEKKEEVTRPLKISLKSQATRDEIFEKARNLPGTEYEHVSIVPDLTDRQRLEDNDMRKEAERLNAEMDPEVAKNWEFRCLGRRGERVIRKVKRGMARANTVRLGARGTATRGSSRGAPAGRGRQSPNRVRNRSIILEAEGEDMMIVGETAAEVDKRKRSDNSEATSSPEAQTRKKGKP